jgi:hypothetical protein
MEKYSKTYDNEKFRVRVWVSDTSDRLTVNEKFVWENKEYRLGQRLEYKLYPSRDKHDLVESMFKDMSRIKLPIRLIVEVLSDVNRILKK